MKHQGLSIYAGSILIVYLFLFYVQFRFPQNTTDSMYNHLSRMGYWLQQSSLKTYFGFSNYGTTYPYNNGLLTIWPIIFLKSDKFVGLVQYFATFFLALSIFLTGNELGFNKKGNAVAALITLTFPIIIFESITAQNDILVVSFLMVAFYLLIKNLHTGNKFYLIFSLLSYALAIGTKQNAIFALPGYALLYAYSILKNKNQLKSILAYSFLCVVTFIIFFGGYAYIQNWINFGSPLGNANNFQLNKTDSQSSLHNQVLINTGRLTYQFLSCEGIPPQSERACTNLKADIFRPVLSKSSNVIRKRVLHSDQIGDCHARKTLARNDYY